MGKKNSTESNELNPFDALIDKKVNERFEKHMQFFKELADDALEKALNMAMNNFINEPLMVKISEECDKAVKDKLASFISALDQTVRVALVEREKLYFNVLKVFEIESNLKKMCIDMSERLNHVIKMQNKNKVKE